MVIRIKLPKNLDIKFSNSSNNISIREGKYNGLLVLELIFSDKGDIFIETEEGVIEFRDARYAEISVPSLTEILKSQGYTIDMLYNLSPVERDHLYYKMLEM